MEEAPPEMREEIVSEVRSPLKNRAMSPPVEPVYQIPLVTRNSPKSTAQSYE